MNGELGKAPRWFLLLVATGGLAAIGAWATHVESHIVESNVGYQRIASLEARVSALEAHVAWCRRQHKAPYGQEKTD